MTNQKRKNWKWTDRNNIKTKQNNTIMKIKIRKGSIWKQDNSEKETSEEKKAGKEQSEKDISGKIESKNGQPWTGQI